MFHIVLYQPEIPPNTGNVIRLCANTGNRLHLIKPLGFELEDSKLRRAGLDYREWAMVETHESFEEFVRSVNPGRIFALSTRGTRDYSQVSYHPDDAFLFGPETRGLPERLIIAAGARQVVRVPMVSQSRSLNLSNSVAIVVYEAWRQQGFRNGT
ncbi:MAG: tRNA (uridine(34)/cytosine(34)/5-carboxymethylaminomethyluridine(34)-2'-O)-methyltransferase TrmL [Thiogranum sp.]|nr:tRNA (uridine(34)/cytosine(34)/5-carboxymethylaminomethyluridine(34)-2'-O)-methyltransferase TrmL [Thiogranum sp.]